MNRTDRFGLCDKGKPHLPGLREVEEICVIYRAPAPDDPGRDGFQNQGPSNGEGDEFPLGQQGNRNTVDHQNLPSSNRYSFDQDACDRAVAQINDLVPYGSFAGPIVAGAVEGLAIAALYGDIKYADVSGGTKVLTGAVFLTAQVGTFFTGSFPGPVFPVVTSLVEIGFASVQSRLLTGSFNFRQESRRACGLEP